MKNTLISIGAASVFTLLFPSGQPAVAGGGANRGESGVVQMQTGTLADAPATNDQLSGTEPPRTPPEIITHVHPSGISVAGVYLDVPNAECGHLIEHALRQNQEIHVADEYCRNIMRRALEIQRNAPPVHAQQGIVREITVPLTILVAGVPLDVPSEACANLIAQALQQNQEVDATDEACRDKMWQALEIQSNPPPTGIPAQEPKTGISVLGAVPFAEHLRNSQ
jgi:hypothetical protein